MNFVFGHGVDKIARSFFVSLLTLSESFECFSGLSTRFPKALSQNQQFQIELVQIPERLGMYALLLFFCFSL